MRKKCICSVLLAGAVLLALGGCGEAGEEAGSRETEQPETVQETVSQSAIDAENLKDAFAGDFKVGVAVNTYQLADEELAGVITENFNSITMENEMKPESLLDQRSSEESEDGMPGINTEVLDRVLTLAKDNGLTLRGHCLVWHSQTPDWFFCEDYEASNPQVDKAEMKKRMESYIQKVLTYCQDNYPGVVYAWDVVNEACDDNGGYRTQSNWYQIYGDESYIEDAFTFARKYADKSVKLFYNDYNEYMPAKRNTIADLLKNLSEKGIVDGVGFQSHWDMNYPSVDLVAAAIEEYAAIPGLELQFTEIDMHNNDDSTEGLQSQAQRYREFFQIILDADREGKADITSVTFWGLNDDVTWLTSFKGEDSYPLMLDEENNRKPCYDSLLELASTMAQD
ncbi:MAG: endo-1,4-beta-xylanase [Lachnospiraceae bacterium]|nr:endo-1,4-beta-xylanase [Lachnospiraceae bacterium]